MAHVRFAQSYPGVPRLIFAELQQAEASPVRLGVQKIMQRYRQVLAETLSLAMAAQRVRPDIDCQAAASLFLGAIQGLVIQSMLSGAEAAVEGQAEAVLALYLAALGVQP